MRTLVRGGIAVVAILAGAVGGYRIGAGQWPTWHALMAHGTAPSEHAATGPQPAARERTVLYWKHPDGEPDFSPSPKKTADARDYLPVYEDQEADFADARAQDRTQAAR